MRKDVECTFGILKGRFRQLKTGTKVHGTVETDRIWLTCCALHNMLLDVDGISQEWESWEGELGLHSLESIRRNIPSAILRRMEEAGIDLATHDYSGMGRGNDIEISLNSIPTFTGTIPNENSEKTRVVNDLDRDYFRKKLVEHFMIKRERNELVWPRSVSS